MEEFQGKVKAVDHSRDLLNTEIDRQIDVLLGNRHVTDTAFPQSVILKLSEEDDIYFNFLGILRDNVPYLGVNDDARMEPEKHGFPAKFLEYLWKIPTFSSPSLSFIQPEIMLEKEIALCGLRRQAKDILMSTSEASILPTLSTWAGQQSSSIVVIRGSSQSTKSLSHLSCQVVNHLHAQKYTMAYILNNLDLRRHFKNFGVNELLRQIACQVLRTINSHLTISLLLEILQHFKAASTARDWFRLFELMVPKLNFFIVVIDASVLEDHAKEAGLWITEFNEIFHRSALRCPACIKVMLLTNRGIDVASEDCLQVYLRADPSSSMSRSSSRLAQARILTEFSLPFFIPASTEMDHTNDSQQSQSHQNDSVMNIGEVEQRLQSNNQYLKDVKVYTPNFSRRITASSLKFYSKDMHVSPMKPHYKETDYTLGHSPERSSIECQRRQGIHVAIICALSWEADAVEVLCDEIYDIHDYSKAPGDANIYNIVQMGRHKAVILYMPAIGKSNAAASGMNCLHSFPNIRLALLTGICGGIPSPYTNAEILLGDVIVSDRLVPYDFGRRFPGGFTRKDTIFDNARKPLPYIAAFLSKLKTRVGSDRLCTSMAKHLNWLRNKSRHGQWATHPGISLDISFESTYHHKHHNRKCEECETSTRSACADARETNCELLGCDRQRTISRKRHQTALHNNPGGNRLVEPFIHFGAYASGDIVMKSGEDRDEIGQREKVIAFEMEGAGIWDNVPTIIVKGVCDYADSHKNKVWQKYAATTAAACVKALLEDWPT